MPSRFGFDAPKDVPIEQSIRWAADNDFSWIDFQADMPPNAIASFDSARIDKVRTLCEETGVAIGIHPNSAVNNAEITPIMSEAVDDYLASNLALAERLGCGWIVAHGGYHFGDRPRRLEAAIERVRRLADLADRADVLVFMENHNKEPEHAEIHYMPYTVEETRWFLDAIQAPHFKWAFNVAHGHLVPEGWSGFLDAFGVDNIGQVRLNDNNGDYEIHLVPGEGTIDFDALFARLKSEGYEGWFSLGYGNQSDKTTTRDRFARLL